MNPVSGWVCPTARLQLSACWTSSQCSRDNSACSANAAFLASRWPAEARPNPMPALLRTLAGQAWVGSKVFWGISF